MSWRDLAQGADEAVDNVFGDNIQLVPWKKGEFSEGVADPERDSTTVVAIPVHYPVNTTEPVNGKHPQLIEADERLSVRAAYASHMRQDDRVVYGGRTFEITMISPSNEGERLVLHLTRVR